MDQEDYLRWKAKIRRLSLSRAKRELRVKPGYQTHEHLLTIVKRLPTDFEPWGDRASGTGPDCSCGCRWFHPLSGTLETDWGACANVRSPRVGLLTFEHMGCEMYEEDPRNEYLWTRAGMLALRRFREAEIEMQKWWVSHSWVKVRGQPIYRSIFRKPGGKEQKKLAT